MKIAGIMKKMIDFSSGDIHDIDHLIRVKTKGRNCWRNSCQVCPGC